MHSAIKVIAVSVGRGTPKVPWPTVRLGRVGKTGQYWHILDPNSPICNTRGMVRHQMAEVDANTQRIDGLPVCAKCRSLLGPVPIYVEKG